MYLFRLEVKCFSRILYLPKLLEFPHISSFHSYSIPSRPQIPLTIFSFLLYIAVSLSTLHCLFLLLPILFHIFIFCRILLCNYLAITCLSWSLSLSISLSLSLIISLSSLSLSFSLSPSNAVLHSASLSALSHEESDFYHLSTDERTALCWHRSQHSDGPRTAHSYHTLFLSLFSLSLSLIMHDKSSYQLFSSSSFPLLKLIPIS